MVDRLPKWLQNVKKEPEKPYKSLNQLKKELEELIANRPHWDDIVARTRYAIAKERLETDISRKEKEHNGEPTGLQRAATWVK